ncbi:hypothetical protein LE721_004443, partial [Salmonella enterica]|nr:hypothetical protein [Salmonella enterica]
SLFCELSRQLVSFAKQLGEQYSGLGFCLACCGKGGKPAGFTSCELLLQPLTEGLL